jgi:hypothetical protein
MTLETVCPHLFEISGTRRVRPLEIYKQILSEDDNKRSKSNDKRRPEGRRLPVMLIPRS